MFKLKKSIVFLITIVVIGAITTVVLLQRQNSSSQPQTNASTSQQSDTEETISNGGEGVPPPQLVTALNQLPEYPRLTAQNGPIDEGVTTDNGQSEPAVLGFYWTNDTAEQVASYYAQTLAQRGWKLEKAPTADTTSFETTLSNTEYRVSVIAGPTDKEPSGRGKTSIKILLGPR